MAIYVGGKTSSSETFPLGEETNVFDAGTGSLSDAEDLRDTYATENEDWLASYDADSSLNIMLMYYDDGDYIVLYQVRLNSAWYNNGSAIGVRGADGSGTDFSGITANHIPAIDEYSTPYDSGLYVDDITGDVTTTGSIQAGVGSLRLGENFTISSGVQAVAFALANDKNALGINCEYDDTGSTEPYYFKLGSVSVLKINTTSDTVISSPYTTTYTTVGDNITTDFIIMPYESGTLKVTFYEGTDDTGKIIFQETRAISEDEVGEEVTFGIGNPYILDDNTDIYVVMSGIQLYGGVAGENDYFYGTTSPFFKSHTQAFTKTEIVEDNPSYIHLVLSEDLEISDSNSGSVVVCDTVVATNDTITYEEDGGTVLIEKEGVYVVATKLHVNVRSGGGNEIEAWLEESTDGTNWSAIDYSGEYREISSSGEGAFSTSLNLTIEEDTYLRAKIRDAGNGSPELQTYTLNNGVIAPSAFISVSRVSNL